MLIETPLIAPDGFAKGCKTRMLPYGQVQGVPTLESRIPLIPDHEIDNYIGEVILRQHVKEILSQGNVGSCGTEMTAGILMATRSFQGAKRVSINPWSMYCYTSNGVDRGSNLDNNLVHAKTVGLLPTAIWPRKMGWKRKPPGKLMEEVAPYFRLDEVYDIASVAETSTALARGYFTGFGWQGHACFLVELLDRRTALYANSWSKKWGDKGFGIIRLSSINYGYGAWAARTAMDSLNFDVLTYMQDNKSFFDSLGIAV